MCPFIQRLVSLLYQFLYKTRWFKWGGRLKHNTDFIATFIKSTLLFREASPVYECVKSTCVIYQALGQNLLTHFAIA